MLPGTHPHATERSRAVESHDEVRLALALRVKLLFIARVIALALAGALTMTRVLSGCYATAGLALIGGFCFFLAFALFGDDR